eukprot:2655390-Prymnesium_polylepis.1
MGDGLARGRLRRDAAHRRGRQDAILAEEGEFRLVVGRLGALALALLRGDLAVQHDRGERRAAPLL